jgi:hypothetical protein
MKPRRCVRCDEQGEETFLGPEVVGDVCSWCASRKCARAGCHEDHAVDSIYCGGHAKAAACVAGTATCDNLPTVPPTEDDSPLGKAHRKLVEARGRQISADAACRRVLRGVARRGGARARGAVMRRAIVFLEALGAIVRQSIGERLAIGAIFLSCTVVVLGLGALFGYLLRGARAIAAMLGLLAVLLLAGWLAGCAVPCRCVCAPAPDPRVRDLQAEIDRQVAEASRLRERLRFEGEVYREREAAPVWIFPKLQPEEGGAK